MVQQFSYLYTSTILFCFLFRYSASLRALIPENDSALFWMIEKTGCVLTDYNSTVGMAMTQSQKEVFDALVARGIISPEYFDITRQRQKMRDQGTKGSTVSEEKTEQDC